MNNKLIWVALAIIVVVALGGYFLLSNKTTSNNITQPQATQNEDTNTKPDTQNTTSTAVDATASGFEPQSITVKVGDTVTWTNTSGETSNVSSDAHPTHLLFPFLNLGNFEDGSSVSVAFDKAGTYTYHNHLNASQKGTVVVE